LGYRANGVFDRRMCHSYGPKAQRRRMSASIDFVPRALLACDERICLVVTFEDFIFGIVYEFAVQPQ